MNTVENQRVIKIQKEKCDDSCQENYYAKINLNALQAAMIDLKGESFKLWMYMSKNQQGYTFALSPVDAIKWGVGSKSSYKRAVDELKEKGYLVETSPNHYNFYEIPKAETLYITKM